MLLPRGKARTAGFTSVLIAMLICKRPPKHGNFVIQANSFCRYLIGDNFKQSMQSYVTSIKETHANTVLDIIIIIIIIIY